MCVGIYGWDSERLVSSTNPWSNLNVTTPVQKVALLVVFRQKSAIEEEEPGGSGYVYWLQQQAGI